MQQNWNVQYFFIRYARKNGYPVLQHTTLPRIGAVKTILDTVGVPQQASDNVEPNGNYQIKGKSLGIYLFAINNSKIF